jgi:hypothetical protein
MRAARQLAVVFALTAIGAAACSSAAYTPAPADQLATLCTDARDQVNAVPSMVGDADSNVSAPKFDQQHTIAADLEPRLRTATASAGHRYDAFLASWHGLVDQLSKTAATFHGEGFYSGDDTANTLLIAGASQDLDKATAAVRTAAKQAGLTGCAQIPWRNWKTQ